VKFLRLAVYSESSESECAVPYDLASQVRRPSAVFKPSRKLAIVAGPTFSMQNDENFQGSATLVVG
jgi:hypothetical protein